MHNLHQFVVLPMGMWSRCLQITAYCSSMWPIQKPLMTWWPPAKQAKHVSSTQVDQILSQGQTDRQTDQGNQLQKDKKHIIGCRVKSLTNYSTSQFIDSHVACKEDFTQQAVYKCVISLHPGFKGGICCLQIQLVATQLTDPQKSCWLMQDRVDYFAFLYHQNKHQQKKLNTKTSTTTMKMTTKHQQKTTERQHEALKLSFLGSSSIFAVRVIVSATYDKFILYYEVDTFSITISTSMSVGC